MDANEFDTFLCWLIDMHYCYTSCLSLFIFCNVNYNQWRLIYLMYSEDRYHLIFCYSKHGFQLCVLAGNCLISALPPF